MPSPIRLTADQLLRLRLRSQRLVPAEPRSFLDVVRASGGLQAQDAGAGLLSARARSRGLTLADADRARVEERTVVRTWVMRGTLHFVPAEDVGWLLPLLGPLYVDRDRQRRAQLGLDDATAARGVRALRRFLERHGPSSRAAIRGELARLGIPNEGQATIHLLQFAAGTGVICYADGGEHADRYTLIDAWIEPGSPLPRDEALAALARKYLDAAAPATPADFAAWSGLPLKDARIGWEAVRSELIEVETPAGACWLPSSAAPLLDAGPASEPVVRLLARFDTYLLLYRTRELVLRPEHTSRIFPGGGILNAAVLVDGRLLGVWRLKRGPRAAEVSVELFESQPPSVYAAIEAEAHEVGAFFGLPARLAFAAERSSGPEPPATMDVSRGGTR